MAKEFKFEGDDFLESCDLCGDVFPLRDLIIDGTQILCRGCGDHYEKETNDDL